MRFPHEIIDLDNDLSIEACVEKRRNVEFICENFQAVLRGPNGSKKNRKVSLARIEISKDVKVPVG